LADRNQATAVHNPAYSCACPKPGQIGRVVAGRASGVKIGVMMGGGAGDPSELASSWVSSAGTSISPPLLQSNLEKWFV